MKKSLAITGSLIVSLACLLGGCSGHKKTARTSRTVSNSFSNSNGASFQLKGVDPEALKLGLNGYYKMQKEGKTNSPYLTIVDFTKPSTDHQRLTVIDVPMHRIVMQTLVAHGSKSGNLYATHFSNAFQTKMSSLGVYLTGQTYAGKHGYSLHVNGEEPGVNSNAAARAIEIHPANYVSDSVIKRQGRLGRTWGCFGVNPEKSKQLINLIKNKSVLFAYADQEKTDPFVNLA